MVAKINSGKSMTGILNYNEHKVKEGVAKCIHASGFLGEAHQLRFKDKLERFEMLTKMNSSVKTNAIHISLNFGMDERLDEEKLIDIANLYMNKIGFGEQPYLVYEHFDAAHSHIHITTTNIKYGGQRMSIHNIGRNQSEKARKEIEVMFNLIKAEGKGVSKDWILDIKGLEKAAYGKSETKKTISKIVRAITRSYKYTSIPELNAVLQQYNVIAERGKEGTITHRKNGLVYSIVDENGNKVGVPIKASSIYGNPTLANLERQFKLNEALRVPLKERVKTIVDTAFSNTKTLTVSDFVRALEKQNIRTLFRQNDEGRVYGITFIDNQNKVVFNGSDLGKQYSAKAIMERLTQIAQSGSINLELSKPISSDSGTDLRANSQQPSLGFEQVVKDLISADLDQQGVGPSMIRRRRKKRKGKSI